MVLNDVEAQDQKAISSSYAALATDKRFVDLSQDSRFILDLRYATTNNFMNKNVYGQQTSCYLHRDAAQMLGKAADHLTKLRPGMKLLIFDALRPNSAQKVLWKHVVGTSEQKYVANPAKGSVHSFGLAVDLTLADEKGQEVDMGTPYDHFDKLAEPQHELEMIKAGRLKPAQLKSRELLRLVMTEAGFKGIPHEWWHFDAFPRSTITEKYQLVP